MLLFLLLHLFLSDSESLSHYRTVVHYTEHNSSCMLIKACRLSMQLTGEPPADLNVLWRPGCGFLFGTGERDQVEVHRGQAERLAIGLIGILCVCMCGFVCMCPLASELQECWCLLSEENYRDCPNTRLFANWEHIPVSVLEASLTGPWMEPLVRRERRDNSA